MAASNLTVEEARQYLHYDPDSGHLVWKVSFRTNVAGQRAGCVHKKTGYWRVGLLGEKHQAHRLAWFLAHGEWPAGDIDHKNGDPADNRLDNLRVASTLVNSQNRRTATAGSASGLLGAQWHKASGMWKAAIKVAGRTVHIGIFRTQQEAHVAYVQAKRLLHEGSTL